MELHPTPESWRVALCTALGALAIVAVGSWVAVVFAGSLPLLAGGIAVALAGLATFLPAVGTLSAAIDADASGVTIRRFGRESHYAWDDIVDVRLVVRRANVPDGTEYHWVVPNRRRHLVAVPSLGLAGGRVREIPALAARADGPRQAAAAEYTAILERVRALHAEKNGDQSDDTKASTRSQTKAISVSVSA